MEPRFASARAASRAEAWPMAERSITQRHGMSQSPGQRLRNATAAYVRYTEVALSG